MIFYVIFLVIFAAALYALSDALYAVSKNKNNFWMFFSHKVLKTIGHVACVCAAMQFFNVGCICNNNPNRTTEIQTDTIMVDSLFHEKVDTPKQVKKSEKPKSKPKQVVKPKRKAKAPRRSFTTHVTLTCYNPERSQCDGDPLVTASTAKIDLRKLKRGELKWCAVSPDLKPYLPFGSIVEIDGYGIYEVKDLMADRIKHGIDILQYFGKPKFKEEMVKVTKLS